MCCNVFVTTPRFRAQRDARLHCLICACKPHLLLRTTGASHRRQTSRMEPAEFIEAEHARLRTKAHRINATSGFARLSLLADYARDLELHQQTVEEVLCFDARFGGVAGQVHTHDDAEGRLTVSITSLPASDRKDVAALMALRRRALDREHSLDEGYS